MSSVYDARGVAKAGGSDPTRPGGTLGSSELRVVGLAATVVGNLRRLHPGLNDGEIADLINASYTTISRWASGRLGISAKRIRLVASRIGQPVEELTRPLSLTTPVHPAAAFTIVGNLGGLVMSSSEKKQSLIGKIAGLPDELVDDAYRAIRDIEERWWDSHGGAAHDAADKFPEEDE